MGFVESAPHLSPEAREFLTNYRVVGAELDLEDLEAVAGARRGSLAGWVAHNEGLAGPWVSRPGTVAGVPVVSFAVDEPALDTDRVIVHLHGGAFVLGSPTASAALAVGVAQRTGLPVVSVDYRLAPEHRCPAATDDIVDVCRGLSESRPVAAHLRRVGRRQPEPGRGDRPARRRRGDPRPAGAAVTVGRYDLLG